ncbi:helix-turn-helix domain-containing protein [Apilactobacillus xinyiensis]|uniref:helix-turn-helix domain-containing protein n=1 Tax=Apilactobacillus xinyiensis TaxID=2841032 RepID=UPI00200FDF7F|nr:helix-turn-helix transcriptional regulator [Apilactobacillus xinyiensis]MCL0330635.1 helix-turn-helix domain-containing protein [Apilactobacillus xinyiensis]
MIKELKDLAQRRKDLHLTQLELAKICNVSKSTLQKWEKRQGSIKKEDILKYAQALHIDPMKIIDPEHNFKHYDDSSEHVLRRIPTVNGITNICMNLEPKRVNAMYHFGNGQLEEQNRTEVTYKALLKNVEKHDLKINGVIHNDSNIEFFEEDKKYYEEFHGILPDDYGYAMKVKTNDLYPMIRKNQRAFLKRAYVWSLFSGNFVIVKNKFDKYKIMQFRSNHNNIYLLPIDRADEFINEHQKRFLMHPDEQIMYVIKLSGY